MLQSKHLLLDNVSGTVEGADYEVSPRGARVVIVHGTTVGTVEIQVKTSLGTYVSIDDGIFNVAKAKLMGGIVSGMRIRAKVTSGTNVTVEISE